MRRKWLTCSLSILLLAGAASMALAQSPGVGGSAPEMKPEEWLNSPVPLSWEGLQGQLILVEKWATW